MARNQSTVMVHGTTYQPMCPPQDSHLAIRARPSPQPQQRQAPQPGCPLAPQRHPPLVPLSALQQAPTPPLPVQQHLLWPRLQPAHPHLPLTFPPKSRCVWCAGAGLPHQFYALQSRCSVNAIVRILYECTTCLMARIFAYVLRRHASNNESAAVGKEC